MLGGLVKGNMYVTYTYIHRPTHKKKHTRAACQEVLAHLCVCVREREREREREICVFVCMYCGWDKLHFFFKKSLVKNVTI